MSDPPDKPERDAPAAAESEAEPRPDGNASKRKPRGKQKRSNLDEQGNEQPPFLRKLPDHPDVNRLIAAFVKGNYAFVRKEADRLAEEADQKEVREAAREIRRRLDPDPLIRYLLVAAFALLAFLIIWAYVAH